VPAAAPHAQLLARFDALLQVSRMVGGQASREEIVRAVADGIGRALGYATVAVNLHRPASDDFVVAEVLGPPEARAALLGTTSTWAQWRDVLDPRHEQLGAYFVPAGAVDWSATALTTYLPAAGDGAPRADRWEPEDALVVPLRGAGDRMLGLLSLDAPRSGRRPGGDELRLLAALTAHLGAALELAEARDAGAERAAALARLARTTLTALGSLDLSDAVAHVCTAVAEGLGFASVELGLVEDGVVVVHHALGDDRRLGGLPAAVLEDVLGDAEVLDACHRLLASEEKPVECFLCRLEAPGGRLLGVLRAADPRERAMSATERRRLLRSFANQLEATLVSAAHLAARASDARRSAVLEASLDPILTMDADGRLVEFNPAAERVFGRRREDVIGKEMAELLIPPAHREAHRVGLRRYREGAGSGRIAGQRIEMSAMRADGSEFPCEVAVVRISGDGPPMLTAYLRDISDRVAARTALERERDAARHAATHDRLTGLPNRAAALAHLAERLPGLLAEGGVFVAVGAELAGCALITDSLGRSAGDRLIRAAAERIGGRLAPGTLLARTGGAEFLVLTEVSASEPRAAEALAAEVAGALRRAFELDGLELQAAATVGYAVLDDSGEEPEDLLRRADVARHRAQASGRDVGGYEARLDVSRRTLTTLSALRGAIDRDELELHYQPLFDVADRRLVGTEALLRWRRDGALVPPGEFIALAETSGLMVPIGEWVVETAARQAAAWAAAGLAAPVMGVNVSPYQLRGTDLPALISGALARHGISPGRFCVEVTESAIQTGAESLVAVLRGLVELGVNCALDDFGVDHSSLTRLAELPVNMVKFDRSFLAGVPEDPRRTKLLLAITGIARALEMRTVAEGIEHADQLRAVGSMGIELAQGFLLARPEPAAALAARLAPAAPAPAVPA